MPSIPNFNAKSYIMQVQAKAYREGGLEQQGLDRQIDHQLSINELSSASRTGQLSLLNGDFAKYLSSNFNTFDKSHDKKLSAQEVQSAYAKYAKTVFKNIG